MNDADVTPGRVAYDAYGDHRNWKVYGGQPMPSWHDQSDDLKAAWEAAAAAVRASVSDGADSVGG